MNLQLLAAGAIAALSFAAPRAEAVGFDLNTMLRSFDTVVLGDLTVSSQDALGPVYVGGDLTSTGGTYVFNSNQRPAGQLEAGGISGGLIVGGTVAAGANGVQVKGDAVIGGGVSGNLTQTGARTTGATIPAADIRMAFQSLSTTLGGLSTSANVSISTDQNNRRITYSAPQGQTAESFVVANLSADYFSSGTFTGVSAPAGTTVVLNVPGQAVSIGANSGGTIGTNFLINFYEATSLTAQSNLYSSILAPRATLSGGSATDGALVVGSATNPNFQFHYRPFTGEIPDFDQPTAVPLPAAALLLAPALGVFALFRRRARA